MAAKAMTEDQMAHMVRNALLVAGQEMGEGDHWPVINSTIHDIMLDVEDIKAQREALKLAKQHYENMIKELMTIRDVSAEGQKAELEATISEVRALYHACFDAVDLGDVELDYDEVPDFYKRADLILSELGDDDLNKGDNDE